MTKRIVLWGFLVCLVGIGSWMLLQAAQQKKTGEDKDRIKPRISSNAADSIITLVAVGDVMMGSNYPSESNCPPKTVKLLDPVASYLQNADLTFANLEGSVLNSGGERKQCSNPSVCFAFRQPEYFVDQMKEAGIDLFSVANNHLGDFGNTGRTNTCRVLREKGFRFAGQETHPWDTITLKGIRIGLTAFAPNRACLQINDYALVRRTVSELKKKCDLVIVSFHGGAEGNSRTHITRKYEQYVGENRGNVYEFARVAIDAGADLILGHGPHVPRAIDLYKGRFITYSMGNFCTYGQFGLSGATGLAPLFHLTLRGDGSFVEGKLISVKQVGKGGPVIDEEKTAQKMIESLTRTDIPEVSLKMETDGSFRFQ